ncbi:MAG: alkaline phosphatase D family protein, partial [Maribacter sp.]
MKYTAFVLFFLSLTSCSTGKIKSADSDTKPDFVLAFGSCNRIDLPNLLWDDILGTKPDVWVWGGDNIYADTGDVEKLRNMYRAQNEVGAYQSLVSATEVMGTWDDHDYGLNDGGVEFEGKAASQQEFLNFMNVPQNSPLRQQEGVYTSRAFKTDKGLLNIIILDTRYFRTALTPDTETDKRIKPNAYGEGSLLGEAQW